MAQTFLQSYLYKSCVLAYIWLIESFERRYAFWLIQQIPLRETYQMIHTLHNTLLISVLESVWLGMRWKRWRTKEKQASCKDGIRIWLWVQRLMAISPSHESTLVVSSHQSNKKALRSLDSPHPRIFKNIFNMFPQGYAAVFASCGVVRHIIHINWNSNA